jgi:hypothetical protein
MDEDDDFMSPYYQNPQQFIYPGINKGHRHPQQQQAARSNSDTPSSRDHHHHQHHSVNNHSYNSIFIPLYGVRKALSARIVNTFVEHDNPRRVAYTIWVYDVESGKEWYAPIRYQTEFGDLRAATLALDSRLSEWEFPKAPHKLSFFAKREADESEPVRQEKCRQLEHFLQRLCSMVYTCQPLHPNVAEIAIHVQSFLGVEAGLNEETELDSRPVQGR